MINQNKKKKILLMKEKVQKAKIYNNKIRQNIHKLMIKINNLKNKIMKINKLKIYKMKIQKILKQTLF